ncbi:MAG: ABC transporter ATP-binding protein [Spirochaetia bacterium]|nr:ABC transporter ATP-binding protein [Spirochaetia bacterium]
MSNSVIHIENISKEYHLGKIDHGTLYRDMQSWWARIRGKEDPNARIDFKTRVDKENFLALNDVSFEVGEGEIFGLIGRNGAGKSTLLKILSRVTAPSKGNIKIKGRVASLLEVGTGFHPELTGRENIFLNGAILGMTKKEIQSKLDEIIDFAEVGAHIDTPVKRYSSGMYVRLAFAVAAHLDPEILIVDEVLAVGDIAFQKKCLGKMKDVSESEGRTVIFVSHNLAAVSGLCTHGVVLDNGNMVYNGSAVNAVNHYVENVQKKSSDLQLKGDDGDIVFISGRIFDFSGNSVNSVSLKESFSIEMIYEIKNKISGIPVPNFHFKTAEGVYVFVDNADRVTENAPGQYRAVCNVPAHLMNDSSYTIGLALTEYSKASLHIHFYQENYLNLTVTDDIFNNPKRYGYGGPIPGVLRPELNWEISKVN